MPNGGTPGRGQKAYNLRLCHFPRGRPPEALSGHGLRRRPRAGGDTGSRSEGIPGNRRSTSSSASFKGSRAEFLADAVSARATKRSSSRPATRPRTGTGRIPQKRLKDNLGINRSNPEFVDARTRSTALQLGQFQLFPVAGRIDYPDVENVLVGLFNTGGEGLSTTAPTPFVDAALKEASAAIQ